MAVLAAKKAARRKRYPRVSYGRAAVRLAGRPVTGVFVAGGCPMCGETFVARRLDTRYCSALCSKRADREQYRARRRAAQGPEPIFRRKVFERDNWTCRICLKPVDRDAEVPDPLAATVDHILPLALGGEHIYPNVQTAHFICNSEKSHNVTQLAFAA